MKSQHEFFTQFFEKPTREGLRELIKQNIGETDYLDFKSEWPDLVKISKHIISLANSGGGAMIFGLHQNDNGQIEAKGLSKIKDKVDIVKNIKKYVPGTVQYEILDFSYNESEYASLKGKMFQVILVEYSEKILPILLLKEGTGINANVAYIREGTESIEANHEKLEHLINTRIKSRYSSSHTLNLREHLEQLQELYKSRKNKSPFDLSQSFAIENFFGNPLNEYYKFIEEIITSKKLRIIKELDT